MIEFRRKFISLLLFIALPWAGAFAQDASSADGSVSSEGSAVGIKIENVQKTFAAIEERGAYVENLRSALASLQNVTLPIGAKLVSNNMEVVLAVNKAVFYPDHTEISIFAKATLPQNDKSTERVLFFGAQGIKLSYDGSIIGDASLALLADVRVPFDGGNMEVVVLGDYDTQTGRSKSKTYMTIDCDGFKELSLDAEVRFPTTLIQSVGSDGKVDNKESMVSGHFTTVVRNWNDIIANITLPPFQICGLDGFVFSLRNVVLDFSDSRNDDAVRFPAGYQQKYMIPGAPTLWRGVYADQLQVTLPKAFDDKDGKPTSFAASGLLIDDNGISGVFRADSLLSFSAGSASGWNFSVNTFKLELEANKLIAAGFAGEIGLPFGSGGKGGGESNDGGNAGGTRLGYEALIKEGGEYVMCVSPTESLDFSLFCAKATIYPNSYIQLHVKNNRFMPEAMLHGKMSVDTGNDAVGAKIPSLEFRGLCVKTEDPYLSIEYLGYDGTVSLGSFPVSLDHIALRSSGSQLELSAGVAVTLGQDMFSGSTRLALLASMRDDNGRKRWSFDGTRLDEIALDAKIAETIELKGRLALRRNDPVYGDGFGGSLGVTVKIGVGDLRVDMRSCFGRVDDFRYWFVDGGVILPQPIPIVGPFAIRGFSGAVSQKMVGVGTAVGNVSAFAAAAYVPDKGRGLGLKASVMFSAASAITGEACFDIAFTSSGGLAFIGFYGYAEFAKKVNMPSGVSAIQDKYNSILAKEKDFADNAGLNDLKLTDPVKAAEAVAPMPAELSVGLRGSIGIQYDFLNHSLHATTDLLVNTPGNFLTGAGQGGKAGWGVLHIDPNEWYLHLGAPDNRIGLKLSLGGLQLGVGSYLMAGSRIPAMPAPPQEVADILRMDLSSLTLGRDIESMSTGKGFAFGTDFYMRTGDITFLILYANFAAGLGFDIMLKDYGPLQCAETGRQIGMDGWYAQGQAYAYLQGELGVKINLWLLKKKVPIITGSTATLMQAMLPNPSAFRGYLGVNANVMGLVKVNMRFKLSLGDECTPIIPGGSPLQMAMISDLAPSEGDAEVSVFTLPQATFTSSLGTPFEADNDAGSATYRVNLKSFTVTDPNGVVIPGTLKWNWDKSAVSFQAKEILPPNTALRARAEVNFEKLTSGRWEVVQTSGKEAIESKECLFTTGGAPNNIPLENVVYSYPVIDQRYFLPGESRKGYAQLQFGQKYLFERGFDYRLAFAGADGRDIPADFRYNEADNRLEYTIPDLATGQQYALSVFYTPDASSGAAPQNATSVAQSVNTDEDGSFSVDKRNAQAEINTSIRKSIFDYGFASSRYATFREKIASINTAGNGVAEDAGVSFRFLYEVRADEPFDRAEITGVDKTADEPLIRPEAELREPFFVDTVNPLLYNGYPFGGLRLTWRDDSEMGVPPVRSVFVYQPYLDLIANGATPRSFFFPLAYEASIIAERDLRNLQSLIVNNRSAVSTAVYNSFVTGNLPFLKKGLYKTVLRYTLPDGTVTSSYDFYFNNFLRFNE